MVKPLRGVLGLPDSPRGNRKAAATLQGVGDSLYDTAEAICNLPRAVVNLVGNSVESVVTGQDKVGLKELYASFKELWEACSVPVQQSGETKE